ncbi:hypothetical protein [Corallococcus macrosporus]|uniref:Uncharacterized protein n=1 Tax=Myxococcus fulvus (strain ATCC BAA-855 / HW-1) TaxID=483219 RepID=F8CBQ9_MYXFH|nr:hypothetical protein [Corallococcus macrosporus]AEI64674.1 hypothetical protein LILAB_13845 [Corallococcus macrosporus]
MRRGDGRPTHALRLRAAARHRLHGREFAPPLLVGVAEDDEAEAPAPPSHLNVVPSPAPLSESAS